ncbi:TPA: hypothetical protein NJ316_002174 [Vibrio parahaemolyticus]|nr:hypothetical protein [Vibrio diabolicus]HCG7071416.1 hypothetical protein [Vibrio parahaemolyticus]
MSAILTEHLPTIAYIKPLLVNVYNDFGEFSAVMQEWNEAHDKAHIQLQPVL